MQHNFFKNKWALTVTALFCCILWGSSFPMVKTIYSITGVTDSFHMITLAGIRFSLSGVWVLLFLRLFKKASLKVEKHNIRHVILLGLLQTFLLYGFYFIGLSNTTGVRSSILVSTDIFIVALISVFAFKDFKLTANKIIGMIIGLAGVAIINMSAFSGGSPMTFKGEGLVFLSTMFAGLASIYIKKYVHHMNVVLLNGFQLLTGGLLLIIVGYMGNPSPIHFGTSGIALMLYMSILSALTFSLWFLLLKNYDVATVTLYKFTLPIFGSILSILIIPDEHFTIMLLPALLLISIGIIVFTKVKKTDTNGIS